MSNPTHFRSALARALVRWTSRWWQASFQAHDRDPALWVGFWDRGAHYAECIALPIARRLDRDATRRQMAEECWWG